METEKDVAAKQAGHLHDYYGRTSVDRGHFHTFVGSTDTETPVANGHVHNYANETRVAENHTHLMTGTSGLQVSVLMGHVHRLSGRTTVNDNHSHSYEVFTGYQRPPRNVRRRGWPAGVQVNAEQEGTEVKPRSRFRFRKPTEK